MRYWVDGNVIVHERVDDEVIVIHLDTGAYFSLRGSGADAWGALCGGLNAEEIVSFLAERYDVAAEEAAAAIHELIRDLSSHSVLAQRPPALAVESSWGEPTSERLAWTRPELQAFTDMQDFLQLDPIHEVDPAGWPHTTAG